MKGSVSAMLLLLAVLQLPVGMSFSESDSCYLFGIFSGKQPVQNICVPSQTSSLPSSYFAFENVLKSKDIRKVVFDISIMSIGLDDHYEKFVGYLTINGMNYYSYPSRGYTIVTLTPGVGFLDRSVFDVYAGADKVQDMTNFLRSLKDGTIVLVSVWDDGSANMKNLTYDILKELGARQVFPLQLRSSYALIGYKGKIRRDFVTDSSKDPGKGPTTLMQSLTWYLPWLTIDNKILSCNYNSSVNEYRWYKDGVRLRNAANKKTFEISGGVETGFYQCSVDFESYEIVSPMMDLRMSTKGGVTAANGKTAHVAAIGVLAFAVLALMVALGLLCRKLRARKGEPLYQSTAYGYSDRYEKVIPPDQQAPVAPRPKEPAQNACVPIAGQQRDPVSAEALNKKKENAYTLQTSRNSGYEVSSYDDSYLKLTTS